MEYFLVQNQKEYFLVQNQNDYCSFNLILINITKHRNLFLCMHYIPTEMLDIVIFGRYNTKCQQHTTPVRQR